MCSTMRLEQDVQHGAYGTVLQDNFSFQDNLRCFGVNYDMSRITRFFVLFLKSKTCVCAILLRFSISDMTITLGHQLNDELEPRPAREITLTGKVQ